MPDSQEERVLSLIKAHGGELVRQKNHHVYRFANGKIFVVPNTPSDCRAWHHAYPILKRFLGIRRRVQKVILAQNRKELRPNTSTSYPALRPFMLASKMTCSTLKSALENCLIAQNDFEVLMLAQGIKKLPAN